MKNFCTLKEDVIDKSSQSIYPQWLPVNAWYFGGTVKLDVFNNEYYIELIENIKWKYVLISVMLYYLQIHIMHNTRLD